MSDLVFTNASQLAAAIRERHVSATEVLEIQLSHIEDHNPTLNAIVTLNDEPARELARQADEEIAQGTIWGPLHGVPITIKDLFFTKGLRTTFGQKGFANFIPKRDSTVVARLKAAGAIILGKTNLPCPSIDFQTHNSLFGQTNNPWNHSYTSGGSSGGGAAAVAAGLSPLDIGSDLGGSIRIPAHFCGVYGFKPTEHRVPSMPPTKLNTTRHLLATGILARSIADLKLGLSIIEGPDNREWAISPITPTTSTPRPLTDYRFAWSDDFGVPLTEETASTIAKIAAKLTHLDCWVERRQPQDLDFNEVWHTFGEIAATEGMISQPALSRWLVGSISSLLPTQFLPGGPIVQGYVRGASLDMRRYMEALTRRDRLIRVMEEFLASCDVWICPVTPGPAFTHRQTVNPLGPPIEVEDQTIPYWLWGACYTSIFSLTGNPVVVIPVALSKEGLPIGIQLVGKRRHDHELLTVAEQLAEVIGPYQRPLGY